MRQGGTFIAGALLLASAGCEPQGAQPADGNSDGAGGRTGFLGPVTYRYDPVLLTPANVRIALPPESEANVNAIKLIPMRSVAESASLCPASEPDCPVEQQPGISLALLERPFARYETALASSELAGDVRRATVAGAPGIVLGLEEPNGLDVEYRLVPVEGRALLIKLQHDGESAAESAAVERVIASIDFGD